MGMQDTITPVVTSAVVAERRTWATNCCGCCCDMRTAVIWVNVVSLIFTIPLALIFVSGTTAMNSVDFTDADADFYQNIEDDEVRDQTIEAMAQMNEMKGASNDIMAGVITMVVIRMICSVLGIYGATKYKPDLVAVCLVSFLNEFVFNAIVLNFLGLIMPGFFAYPHLFFIRELKRNAHAGHIAEHLPTVEMADVDEAIEPLPVQARIV